MRIVCLSDTHGFHEELEVPDGDVLVHAGDLTLRGFVGEVAAAINWMLNLPHKHKVFIAGNHDFLFEKDPGLAKALYHGTGLNYLQDSEVEIEGLRFYGSPWQPEFHDWAFNLPRGKALADKWMHILPGTDVLVTHGPPYEILDAVKYPRGLHVGCGELRKRLMQVRPKLHVFGHIHEGYGEESYWHEDQETKFVNASICNVRMDQLNRPIVVDL